ncbi:methionine--tRNA ligase [Patescibacteria group bacterium]|nr:MAG: methionine--tRNA ligase [Patescibacteria group bacterium]
MAAKNTAYITTTLPYVNADPHIGFALEIVQADVVARYWRLLGKTVVFNTGTDEHGLKIWKNAQEAGLDPKTYSDGYAAKFHGLKDALNLSYTHFIRTTDEHHVAAAQEFWRRCLANGDIYKKSYQIKYCVGCELEKTDSELVDGRCPIHPKLDIEIIDEENYFFRFSKYAPQLLAHYDAHPDFVVPASRLNEIRSFVAGGLQDFSISRLASKLPWGVPVPDDPEQVMYVWFDALVNYISTIGWPTDLTSFEAAWPGVQVAGKDNLRQQSAMWQAMLLSAGLPLSKQIFIHGFITADGQKMSKSLGNVVNPYDLVAAYGTDPVRYFLLGGLPSYEDGDFSQQSFDDIYGSKLANGVGNLAARVATMIGKYAGGKAPAAASDIFDTAAFWKRYDDAVVRYRFDEAVKAVEELVAACNKEVEVQQPFKKAKAGEDVGALLYQLSEALRHIGLALLPVIPASAAKLLGMLSMDAAAVSFPGARVWGTLQEGTPIASGVILFPRRDATS